MQRRLRIGVTELTAMTWLSRFVSAIQAVYPKVLIEPDVNMSTALRDKLLADELELIIVPQAFDDDERFMSRRVAAFATPGCASPGSFLRPTRCGCANCRRCGC